MHSLIIRHQLGSDQLITAAQRLIQLHMIYVHIQLHNIHMIYTYECIDPSSSIRYITEVHIILDIDVQYPCNSYTHIQIFDH